MIIPGQTTLIAAGVSLAVGLGTGFTTGVRITNHARDAKELVAQREVQARYEEAVNRGNKIAAKLEEEKTRVERHYEDLDRRVDAVTATPVYHSCKLDDDGLRLWNEANQGPASPGVADGTVRDTTSTR